MAVIFELKVIPNSKKQGVERDKSGILKCRLRSKPEDGKANEELIRFLGKALGIPTNCFRILRGATSRNKMIKIDAQNTSITLAWVLEKLGEVESQKGIK